MRTSLELKRITGYSLLCCGLLTASAALLGAQAPPTPATTPAPAPAAAPAPTPVEATATLTVHIMGFRNAKGKAGVVLFKDGKGFPADMASVVAANQADVDPQTLSATVVFKNLPQGIYAASVLHDENLSGKMEFDSQGIPQSGYGISNNPDTSQGPPTADQANFPVKQSEATIDIKMVYWQ
jgi:uncharacterized protein (DUF2141 family)